jgi:hypothetical protein
MKLPHRSAMNRLNPHSVSFSLSIDPGIAEELLFTIVTVTVGALPVPTTAVISANAGGGLHTIHGKILLWVSQHRLQGRALDVCLEQHLEQGNVSSECCGQAGGGGGGFVGLDCGSAPPIESLVPWGTGVKPVAKL